MTFIWNRRRPSLGKRIAGSLLLVAAAAGLSMGAEILRRKLRIGEVDREGIRPGRPGRGRVLVARAAGGRRRRIFSEARS
jgi:hypothetical protein